MSETSSDGTFHCAPCGRAHEGGAQQEDLLQHIASPLEIISVLLLPALNTIAILATHYDVASVVCACGGACVHIRGVVKPVLKGKQRKARLNAVVTKLLNGYYFLRL